MNHFLRLPSSQVNSSPDEFSSDVTHKWLICWTFLPPCWVFKTYVWLSLFLNAYPFWCALPQGEPVGQMVCICLSAVTTVPHVWLSFQKLSFCCGYWGDWVKPLHGRGSRSTAYGNGLFPELNMEAVHLLPFAVGEFPSQANHLVHEQSQHNGDPFLEGSKLSQACSGIWKGESMCSTNNNEKCVLKQPQRNPLVRNIPRLTLIEGLVKQ